MKMSMLGIFHKVGRRFLSGCVVCVCVMCVCVCVCVCVSCAGVVGVISLSVLYHCLCLCLSLPVSLWQCQRQCLSTRVCTCVLTGILINTHTCQQINLCNLTRYEGTNACVFYVTCVCGRACVRAPSRTGIRLLTANPIRKTHQCPKAFRRA